MGGESDKFFGSRPLTSARLICCLHRGNSSTKIPDHRCLHSKPMLFFHTSSDYRQLIKRAATSRRSTGLTKLKIIIRSLRLLFFRCFDCFLFSFCYHLYFDYLNCFLRLLLLLVAIIVANSFLTSSEFTFFIVSLLLYLLLHFPVKIFQVHLLTPINKTIIVFPINLACCIYSCNINVMGEESAKHDYIARQTSLYCMAVGNGHATCDWKYRIYKKFLQIFTV